MLVPFLIMLREGIEAALIVGIVASYLKRSGSSSMMYGVTIGVLLAVALSFFVGAGLQVAVAEFPQKEQELFEAVVGLIAVAMLTSMVFWMRRAGASVKGELQHSVDHALAGGRGRAWALIGVVFLAVAREGLESVFFLLAIFQQSAGWQAPLGAITGLLCAIAIGYGIYSGGLRLNLRRFFRLTGVFILFVSAGLLAGALRKFHEAGVWNHLQTVVFDIDHLLPLDSPLGTVLSGLFGYQSAPVTGEVLVYVFFLVVSLYLFLRHRAPGVAPARASA
ncbi:iron uptake transporter permease EfeU [Bordetella sp. 15P40C-2]|uniref:iron uptake transporter permease EfeU n=1 Tax=Bordetella sp. 15P40C-2 TaxID=2572246 RepID=UPI00132B5000|nr:iron uptake transporter permease EfeU [Bordetella sp. 15P40C-2]MVW71671.1 iron transporter [Bordetella sp. 15P40C-2]